MRAALATTRVLQQEGLATRAGFLGSEFRKQLRAALTALRHFMPVYLRFVPPGQNMTVL